jgi:hypothetical protein
VPLVARECENNSKQEKKTFQRNQTKQNKTKQKGLITSVYYPYFKNQSSLLRIYFEGKKERRKKKQQTLLLLLLSSSFFFFFLLLLSSFLMKKKKNMNLRLLFYAIYM